MSPAPRILVIGAGAFGGWTALHLVRQGAAVTLLDAWGPGHVRSSSGGETRIIRATYGSRTIYTTMAAKALRRWREEESWWHHGCLHRSGALWMGPAGHPFLEASATALTSEGIPFQRLSPKDAARRYPQIHLDDIGEVLVEPDAGFLLARHSCARVVEQFQREGGTFDRALVRAPFEGPDIVLADGRRINADAIVLAAGPWLGSLLPEVIGPRVTPTRQPSHYFGTPAGDSRFEIAALPIWLEMGEHVMYGIPGDGHRSFKLGDDHPGAPFDPSRTDRTVTPAEISTTRQYLAHRFPGMADAPWLAADVCQYEATPDSDFIIDQHPDHPSTWIVGGGSGHGFKMGPVIGELVAAAVLGERRPDPMFALSRFASGHTPEKWS